MPRAPYTKTALSYRDQVQQLISRGLIVSDKAKTLHLLEKISYYRLSGYWFPMLAEPKTTHSFKTGSTFDNAFKLYCFDRELRALILGELEKIEIAVRAKMIYEISHRHGPFWHLNAALFSDPAKHSTAVYKLGQENSRSDEEFIKAFRKNYSDPLPPSWMMLEITSFGSLSHLYSNLKPGRDKRAIANYFGLDDRTFQSWLHSFTYIRNVCAHHARLWNKILGISPQVPVAPLNQFLNVTTLQSRNPLQPPVLNNNRAYFLLSMIIYCLNTINPKHSFKTKLADLLGKYSMIDVKAMGFPVGWEAEPLWDWRKVQKDRKWYNRVLKKFL